MRELFKRLCNKGKIVATMLSFVVMVAVMIMVTVCAPPVVDDTNGNGDGGTNDVVDTNAPTVPVVSGDADSMNKTPTWTWSSDADAVKYRYSFVDGSNWTETNATSFTSSTNLAVNSTNTLYVQAADTANNWSDSGSNTIVVMSRRFTEINPDSLTDVSSSSIDLGDIDGDGDLDLILTGYGSGAVSKIYQNDGSGAFTEINSGDLTGVYFSSIDLGDIDGDGDLDLILTGDTGSGYVSMIYTNNGSGGFGEINSGSLIGVRYSSIKLGDINGNGTNDLILTGDTGSGSVSMIYTNNGSGSFSTNSCDTLTGVNSSSIDLGDIDGDGDLDLILTGYSSGYVSKIYTNNGSGGFSEDTSNPLTGVSDSSIKLGDINGNGTNDLILTGDAGSRVSMIYTNNGSGSFTEINPTVLTGVNCGSIDLGDIDNDGDLDLILTGWIGVYPWLASKIYTNNGSGGFSEDTSSSLPSVGDSSIMLGDIDGDGDLDLILTGDSISGAGGEVSKIYRNNTVN